MDEQMEGQLKLDVRAKRNIAKETAWQKEKYKRFGFAVDKAKGEKFIEVLTKSNKTPLQWFKEQVDKAIENTVTVDTDTVTVGKKDTVTVNTDTVTVSNKVRKKKSAATAEMVAEWSRLYQTGMSFSKIAAGPEGLGYDRTTIAKRVAAYARD